MINYRVWEADEYDFKLVEIFNKNDILSVQKEFIEKGYIILGTELEVFGSTFIKVTALEIYEKGIEIDAC